MNKQQTSRTLVADGIIVWNMIKGLHSATERRTLNRSKMVSTLDILMDGHITHWTFSVSYYNKHDLPTDHINL